MEEEEEEVEEKEDLLPPTMWPSNSLRIFFR